MRSRDGDPRYKAQVHDLAMTAFFKLRELDAKSLGRSKPAVGWDIAEAMIAAAVGGLTYKSQDRARWAEAARLLRNFATEVEDNGLSKLAWGYLGTSAGRQAWRPDIRTAEGLAELEDRVFAVLDGLYQPLRALTTPDKRAIICFAFARVAYLEAWALAQAEADHNATRAILGYAEVLVAKLKELADAQADVAVGSGHEAADP